MARHAAVPSSVSNVIFDLGSIACCIQHSVFRRSSCARVCGWRDGSGAMFLGVVCSMQGRRRCILDGVGISVQRILVSIFFHITAHTAHGDRCSCWFYLWLGVLQGYSAHAARCCCAWFGLIPSMQCLILDFWLPILSCVCTTRRLAPRERNDVHSPTHP
jgi:hypothetical protein